MLRFLLITMLGLLLVGCTGQVPYATLPAEESPSIEAFPAKTAQAVASPVQDPSVPTESLTEEVAASGTLEPASPALPGIELFTFVAGEPGWYTVDDNVMGGVSSSTVTVIEPDALLFAGNMSLENNGGFASVRSEWRQTDLSGTDGVLLRVLGDGKSYRLRTRAAETGPNISYNALFDTTPDTWQLVYVPFAGMVPTYFGSVMDVEAIDTASIGSFGFMLSDKQPGEFGLLVDWIRAVSEEELLTLGD